ncbi:hypothetical protein H9P43_001620 [Blastocladiella emersonii ATCC 22665]|nr:hypothetical protein H9P43_001620 [Blastocladiella emersonii ATCC 22665]
MHASTPPGTPRVSTAGRLAHVEHSEGPTIFNTVLRPRSPVAGPASPRQSPSEHRDPFGAAHGSDVDDDADDDDDALGHPMQDPASLGGGGGASEPQCLPLFASASRAAVGSPVLQELLRWQRITLLLLIAVYTGYYFCRTNLSVALPTLLHATHISKGQFGSVISFGYGFYAMGKLANGVLIDRVGGHNILIACLLGSILCTVAFGSVSDESASIPLFSVIWSANRVFQSGGWPALTTLVRNWFPPMQHGKIMGIASLSYSLGDAIIRLVLGKLVSAGFTWQQIFFFSAFCGTALVAPAIAFLKSSPTVLGLPTMLKQDPAKPILPAGGWAPTSDSASPGTAVRHSGRVARAWDAVASNTLLAQPKYLLLLLQSPLFTWTREIFNSWVVVYLHEAFSIDEGTASVVSLAFPLLAAVSSVGGGFLIDRVARHRRGVVYTTLVLCAALTMSVFATVATHHQAASAPVPPEGHPEHTLATAVATPASSGTVALAVALIGLAALFSTAPASWAEGIFALELANHGNAGIAVAAVHSSGYIGAILAGKFVGSVVEAHGWGRLFVLMSLASLVNAVLAAVYWYVDAEEHDAGIRKAA